MRDFYTKENMQGAAYHVPDAGLSFEPAALSFETETDTGREGVIRVRHRAGKPARGYVYPSERCMRGVREQFAPAADGTGMIRWQFDARGIAPGRTVRGFFRVISPYGEYRIPYTVEVSGKGELVRRKADMRNKKTDLHTDLTDRTRRNTAVDKQAAGRTWPGGAEEDRRQSPVQEIPAEQERAVRTRADFLALAREDFSRSVSFFYSRGMEDILDNAEVRTLYRGLSVHEGNRQNVEEFLIAACGMEKTVFEPVEKSLFLQTRARAGRTETHLAGSRAERALEAHRQRVRRSGISGGTSARPSTEDLVYIPMQIRQTGRGFCGPVIRAEGQFLPSAPFAIPTVRMPDQAANLAEDQTAEKESIAAGTEIRGRSESDVPALSLPQSADGAGAEGGDVASAALLQEKAGQEGGRAEQILTVRIPVNRAALHAGRNYGRVIVQGPFQEKEIPVTVHCPGSGLQMRRRQEQELELLQLQMMRMYVDFRLEEKHPEDWFLQADRLIDQISVRSHRDLVPRLYGVHLLILRGQDAEARRELGRIAVRYAGSDAAQNLSARFTGEKEGAYCYRQYLTARCRMEDTQLRTRVVRFLHGVYRQSGDWRTAWMLLDLAEEYAPGTAARWNFLRRQFENGCNSPVIWIEAWDMVRRDPQILLPGSSVQERWARDDFSLHVLWYAARNNVLTRKAAEVMISLAEKKKTFSGILYRGLCAAWEMAGSGKESAGGSLENVEDSRESAGGSLENVEDSRDYISGSVEDGNNHTADGEDPAKDAPERIARTDLLRAICIQLVRGQDLSPRAHRWYTRALEAGISLTRLEESWRQSMPADDARYRLPAGRTAILRTTAARAVRAVIVYDRFREEELYPVRGGIAFLPVYGSANTVFLEDAAGNRYAGSLPYALDIQEESLTGRDDYRALAAEIGFGDREEIRLCLEADASADAEQTEAGADRRKEAETGADRRKETETYRKGTPDQAALQLLDCGQLTASARTQLLLECLRLRAEDPAALQAFLTRVDPAQCGDRERTDFLQYLTEAGMYETAVRWLAAYGDAQAGAGLLGQIVLGLAWEGGMQAALVSEGWEAFLRGNRQRELLERLAASFSGLSDELVALRRACADSGLSTTELDRRIIRQTLFSGAMSQDHAQILLGTGRKLEEVFLPAVAGYADFSFSEGLSMGSRMTELIAGMIADGVLEEDPAGKKGTLPEGDQADMADICRIACLKELSMRQGEVTQREQAAARASLSALLSKGIIFPFFRQFPGYDDRLDLYAEETLVQYHPAKPEEDSGRHIVFHYTTSRRGETGSYRARPMKEMYRDFYVSGFLLFYGEQMHYYITDDEAQKNVVQSGMIGQDARILENCSGRFGLINETTRAAALRDYDEALSLLTGYYRRSYLENELFRR